jgi:hypothetical protein
VFDITALDRVMGGEADLTAVTSSFVDFGRPGGVQDVVNALVLF